VDVYAVTFNADDSLLGAATEDGSVVLWDLATRSNAMRIVGTHLMEADGMTGLAFHESENLMISSSLEETMRWDLKSGTARTPIPGGYASVNGNGDIAAIGSDSDHIVLIDVLAWQAFSEPLGRHEEYITAIAFEPAGNLLATAGRDGNVLLWDVDMDSWVRRACETAGRNISAEEWARYLGDLDYRDSCPDAPIPVELPLDAEQALGWAVQAAKTGDEPESSRLFALAANLAQETPAAEICNEICWNGAIFRRSGEVLPACDLAVKLEPRNGSYRDSRGLVHALSGDTENAIADFRFYIEWIEESQRNLAERRARREYWVEELEAGRFPFDDLTMLQLRNEAWSF